MAPNYAEVSKIYETHKNLKKEDVNMIKQWLASQNYLPSITELQIILFLYSCHCSNEATKKCIDNYYSIKTHCPEFFSKRIPDSIELKNTMETLFITPLPKLTPEGYVVYYFGLRDSNPDRYQFNSGVKLFDMTTSLHLQEAGPLDGHKILIDLRGVQIAHLTKVGPFGMKKFMFFLQEAIPFRLKGFHYVNAVPFMDKIMALVKPFMYKELIDMMTVHQSNTDTIYKIIPKECLPKHLGGTAGDIADITDNFLTKVKANAPFFAEEEKLVVDENHRPGKPKNAGDLFGVEGTFKKLDID